VVGKDRRRPEQLLSEHRPDEKVRPGRRAERQQQVGAPPLIVAVTARCADQEPRLALAVVAPAVELLGQLNRG